MSGYSCQVCIVGGGSAGLSLASGLAQLGLSVVLLERGEMGGDCLNSGCVPSKALLASAKQAVLGQQDLRFGLQMPSPAVDWPAVQQQIEAVQAKIAPHDSQERFEGLGVRVIRSTARFVDRQTIAAEGEEIRARRFVLATGSRPFIPPIEGLDKVPYLTNETLFGRLGQGAITHLLVLGGGPIGLEMAQAHRRLGVPVTLVEKATILPQDDPELVAYLRRQLDAEGVRLCEGTEIRRVQQDEKGLTLYGSNEEAVASGSHLLVAAGREPQVDGLNLAAAGVEMTPRGITVDARLRTTNPRVFAMGDVTGGAQFTHWSSYHASLLVRQLAFRLAARVDTRQLPWVTYTSPEIAQVGLSEAQAEAHGIKVSILRQHYSGLDRAVTERYGEGLLKLLVSPGNRVLGASLVGAQAGELIAFWAQAIAQKTKLSAIASLVLPYPTLSEIHKQAAAAHYAPRLFSPKVKRLVRFLQRF